MRARKFGVYWLEIALDEPFDLLFRCVILERDLSMWSTGFEYT